MRLARALVAGALLLGGLGFSTMGCEPPKPYAGCGSIGMLPNSDAGVWNIQAHNAGCADARTLASQWWHNSHGRPYNYLAWSCTGAITVAGQLGQDVWCNGPRGAVVTFTSVG